MKRYLPIVIILAGILLQWYALNWGLPNTFHPDETRLLYVINDISWENLNPKFFAYGSLPIYLLKVVYEGLRILARWLEIHRDVNFFLIGRAISAFFGSLTLILMYVFGKRFFSTRVALLSTVFLAFTVLHIQLSHFLTVDVMLTFFILLAMYFAAMLVEGFGRWRQYLLAGAAIGLALAVKISAFPVYLVLIGAHLLVLFRRRWAPLGQWRSSKTLWLSLLVGFLVSVAVFVLCEPYAILDFQEFYRQVREQSDMVRGLSQPPYFIQYEKTTRYIYPIVQLVRYSMGAPLGMLALIGTVFMLLETLFKKTKHQVYIWRQPEGDWHTVLLLLLWVIPVFLTVGGFKVKFLRYMLPLIPFFCLLGAIFIERLLRDFPRWKPVIYSGVIAVIGFSAFYAIAFASIYAQEDPRVQASKWIYKHIQPGSGILTETWEFISFVAADRHQPGQYRTEALDMYLAESDAKFRTMARQLSRADIIFLATKRMYGSILRIPERYPKTVNYYKLLFDGDLGFQPVQTFTRYPSLFGISFKDDFADESFSVYEHPKVILFQKTRALSEQELYHLLMTAPRMEDQSALLSRFLAFPALESKYSEIPRLPTADSLVDKVLTLEQTPPAKEGIRRNWQAILIWLAVIELLGIIAFPLISLTFRNLPDAGYAISKVIGILLPAYVVWLLVSLNVVPYLRGVIAGSIVCLGLAMFWIASREIVFFTGSVQAHWRIWIVEEAVFLLAFAGFLIFRAYNPDIFWSESAMDFSFLTVLTRTDTLPPPDPWISGYPLNYYYFGHYLVATLTKLTGIAPQVAYNLAYALFPAFVIVEVFSLLYALTKRYLWGLVGVVFATLLGNLDGFFLLFDWWRGKEATYRFFRCAHEVIPHTVHEFPFWTFIFVDLHAHLLSMPFLIAVFLIGFDMLQNETSEGYFQSGPFRKPGERMRLFGIWVLLPLVVGTLGVISSWDYPTGVFFLLFVAIVQAYTSYPYVKLKAIVAGVRSTSLHFWKAARYMLVMIPMSLLLYLPFYLAFSRKGMGVGLVGSLTTPLSRLFTMFGFFFFLILSWLVVLLFRSHQARRVWHVVIMTLITVGVMYGLIVLALAAAYTISVIDLRMIPENWVNVSKLFAVLNHLFARAADRVRTNVFDANHLTMLFGLVLIAFGSYTLFPRRHLGETRQVNASEQTYIWLCLMYASLIVIGCELIFVRDFLQGGEYKRMNTIFKFYMPAWFLLSFAATYACFRLFEQYIIPKPEGQSRAALLLKQVWVIGFGILFCGAAVFPGMAVYARRHQQDLYLRIYTPPTLDGLTYLKATSPDEYQAIRWLNEHVAGTPVILEAAVMADYKYEYTRISSNTGIPTVLGWQSHVEQREHWGLPQRRFQDINTIYTSGDLDVILPLLRTYHVNYIYVGETERRDFPEAGLRIFQDYPEYFERVFQSGDAAIYRVTDN